MAMHGPSRSYCTLIDEMLKAEQDKEDADRGSYPLRPSAAGECGRKLAHQLMGWHGYADRVVEDRKPNIIRLLKFGHDIEAHSLKYIERLPGFSVRFKQQIVDTLHLKSGKVIEGSTDAVMWSEEHRAVLDVKSVGDRWDQSYKSKWDAMIADYSRMQHCTRFDTSNPDVAAFYVEDVEAFLDELGEDALAKNIIQINLYCCADFFVKRRIDHGVVYRYCKNNSRHMEVRFKPSPALVKRIEAKFNVIEAAVEKRKPELVPQDYRLGSMACAYCPFNDECWPHAKRADFFSSLPPKEWPTKMSQVKGNKEFKQLFSDYTEAANQSAVAKKLEAAILDKMLEERINKVQLDDGTVYAVAYLKSPKPHHELRKSKA